jgi:hypothetical protein
MLGVELIINAKVLQFFFEVYSHIKLLEIKNLYNSISKYCLIKYMKMTIL